jgi:hypothetical protein
VSDSLIELRGLVDALVPRVDLPELLLEVNAWSGFASQFTHLSEGTARVQNLATSICAIVLAEACNIGLEPLVRQDVPWLTRGRLSWVHQNYLRADTLTQANARLVDYQATVQLAQRWGGGEVASADSLRFVVPVRTLNAGHNPKYFGVGRGVDSDGVVASPLTRGLIAEERRFSIRGASLPLVTTGAFLRYLLLQSLAQMPALPHRAYVQP